MTLLDGPAVLLDARTCAQLARALEGLLRAARRAGAHLEPWLVADIGDVIEVGHAFEGARSADVPRGIPPEGDAAMLAGEVGTAQAARRLGCSERNVRALCARGTLEARHDGRRWWLQSDTVDALAAERHAEGSTAA